jgi:tRNA(fMet)-specific endonuclease VapC
MSYLLDTNVCIGIMRNTSPKIIARISHVRRSDVFLNSIVRLELTYGIERCARPTEETRRVERLWNRFPSIDFDDNCADEAARLRAYLEKQGLAMGAYDMQIAAIARFHNLTLVTHDVGDFQRAPNLLIEDWEM